MLWLARPCYARARHCLQSSISLIRAHRFCILPSPFPRGLQQRMSHESEESFRFLLIQDLLKRVIHQQRVHFPIHSLLVSPENDFDEFADLDLIGHSAAYRFHAACFVFRPSMALSARSLAFTLSYGNDFRGQKLFSEIIII